MIHYIADPVNNRLLIAFAPEDKPVIEQMMGRALNTWEPQPPKALLDVYDQLRGQAHQG